MVKQRVPARKVDDDNYGDKDDDKKKKKKKHRHTPPLPPRRPKPFTLPVSVTRSKSEVTGKVAAEPEVNACVLDAGPMGEGIGIFVSLRELPSSLLDADFHSTYL